MFEQGHKTNQNARIFMKMLFNTTVLFLGVTEYSGAV